MSAKRPTRSHPGSPSIGRDLLQGMVVTALLIGLKVCIDYTGFGKQMQLMTNNLLQIRLRAPELHDELPVAIVDISDLEPTDIDINGYHTKVTPRKELRDLIDIIANRGARAIGVDIDFSPDVRGYKTLQDPEFFQDCIRISQTTGVPIFLGIYRSQHLPSKNWLGDDTYHELARSIMIPKGEVRRLIKWTRPGEDSSHAMTMGAAMAGAIKLDKEKTSRDGFIGQFNRSRK